MSVWFQSLLEALDGVAYLTNPDGVVLQVGRRNWETFAEANDAPELTADSILHRSIFEMLSGEEVRKGYRAMHEAVASGARGQANFTCRCDAPDVARWMRMSLTRVEGPAGMVGVLYQSTLTRAEVRPSVALFAREHLLGALRDDRRPIVVVCSYCQFVSADSRGDPDARVWTDAETYYRQGGSSDVKVSHGICSPCYATVVEPNTAYEAAA